MPPNVVWSCRHELNYPTRVEVPALPCIVHCHILAPANLRSYGPGKIRKEDMKKSISENAVGILPYWIRHCRVVVKNRKPEEPHQWYPLYRRRKREPIRKTSGIPAYSGTVHSKYRRICQSCMYRHFPDLRTRHNYIFLEL